MAVALEAFCLIRFSGLDAVRQKEESPEKFFQIKNCTAPI